MSGKFRGFFDILTGFLLGASTIKIYYESTQSEDVETFTYRQNKRKIEEICASHDNLNFRKSERRINEQSGRNARDDLSTESHEVFKFGKPTTFPGELYYKHHVLHYDNSRKVPLWVAEHLTSEKLFGTNAQAERTKSSFLADPNIPEIFQAKNQDYWKSGWTRGHMAPAGDYKFDQQSMNETFLLSNILPQDFENNANFWYRLELFCRNLTKRFDDVYVISGPLWLPRQQDGKKIVKYEVIGENNVAVPTHLFKIILAIDSMGTEACLAAFEIPNEPVQYEKKLVDFQVPVEKLEKDSGFKFFDAIEKLKGKDLCKVTNCQLMEKEKMDIIIIHRQLMRAQSIEQLDKIWQDTKQKKLNFDSVLSSAHEKQLRELQKKETKVKENDNKVE